MHDMSFRAQENDSFLKQYFLLSLDTFDLQYCL